MSHLKTIFAFIILSAACVFFYNAIDFVPYESSYLCAAVVFFLLSITLSIINNAKNESPIINKAIILLSLMGIIALFINILLHFFASQIDPKDFRDFRY